VADPPLVVVLAGRRYAGALSSVWPRAVRPLDGTRSMGEQLQRLAAIARDGLAAAAPARPQVTDVGER
jgi:hypothetical protein